jgi:hypothetical protein
MRNQKTGEVAGPPRIGGACRLRHPVDGLSGRSLNLSAGEQGSLSNAHVSARFQ